MKRLKYFEDTTEQEKNAMMFADITTKISHLSCYNGYKIVWY